MRWSLVVLAFALLATVAGAQTVFDQNGFGAGRGTYSALPYEHVDPLSGNLLIVTTDLTLPGNAGLDINVQRVYNSAVYPHYENGGDKTLDEDSWAGVGWRLHFGRVIDSTNTSSAGAQIEMSDGSHHPLYNDPTSAGWITKDFWLYNRDTNTLRLTNGLVYTFGRVVVMANLGTVRYVTEIRDPHNNTITFDYFTTGPVDGVQRIRQDLGAGQVREVFFEYDPTLLSLKKMIYNGSEWVYTQTAFGSGYNKLVSVQPPAGGAWSYGYEAAPFVGLTSLTAPSGGVVSYAYADATRYAGTTTQFSRVVATRSISGPTNAFITPGTWIFSYNTGSDKDQTIVDCPCGKTLYRYYGIGTGSTGFEAWRTGLLAERRVLGQFDAVLEREELTWQRSEAISPDAVPAANGIWGDSAVYNALLAQRIVRRDAKAWTTTYAYRTGLGTYNDYGTPQTITATDGTRTRTTSNTFRYGFTPYIVGRLASSTVTMGSESASATWVYESLTGFLLDQTARGMPIHFARTVNGNLGSITDAHGHQTHFQYSWGIASQTQTPLVTTERTISPAGLVTREQVGTLYTDYEYDVAFRPKAVRPLNANPILYWYDSLWDGWTRVERGSSSTQYNLDGFGRPVSTVNFSGIKTRTGRDACGRVTFQSLPYTDAQYDNRGMLTTYDALGRVTKSRFYDGIGGGGPDTAETTFVYDGLNVTATDAIGRITKQEYSAISGPGDAVLTAVTDAANQQTFYAYDIADQLRQVSGVVAPRTWTYNANGLLQQATHPESGTTSYTYDAAGLVKTVTDAAGQVFTLSYDANDRLMTRDGPGTASDVTVTYDALGRLSTQQTDSIATTYQYDSAGRQASRTDVFQGRTYVSSYGYDLNDNLTTLTYPSGRVVGYSYDVENRLTGITQNGASFASNFQYDDGGGPKSYVTGAVTHQVEYDRRQRVKRLTVGASTPALDLTYSYNTVNQMLGITDARPPYSWSFYYDSLNRLVAAGGPYTAAAWTYDGKGNRTSEQIFDAVTSYSYDQTTQRLTSTSGAVSETFGYDALGRLANDSRGAYTYTPGGMLASVTSPNVAASYIYDADGQRILRTVNGVSVYAIRSAGGQTLTEYESPCGGTPIFARDLVYAGARLVGVMRATSSKPTVGMVSGSSSVSEATGVASLNVAVTTPTGATLACPVTVSYQTESTGATATDYVPKQGTVTFPAGTVSGATQAITVTLVNDVRDESNESVSVQLTSAIGATLGATIHTVTIVDDDPPPGITINDVNIAENGGLATFTVSLSASSAFQVDVDFATQQQTATAGGDYDTASGRLVFPAGTTSQTIAVGIRDDAADPRAEQPETFLVSLSSAVNATITRASGVGTILDNERPRAPINPLLPGYYFPDLTLAADTTTYLSVFNPHPVAITARLTFTRRDGSGKTRDVSVPALQRITLDLNTEPDIAGQGDVSMVVQSLDPSGRTLVTDASSYWQTDWRGGRTSRGAPASPDWYFAEGATTIFDEYITVYNPSNEPAFISVYTVQPGGGVLGWYTYQINEGPGRLKIRVNDLLPGAEHGTAIFGRTLAGANLPIVVERTMYWEIADRREGHSTTGNGAPSLSAYLAEGGVGAYSNFLAVLNPNASGLNLEVRYLHENGITYTQSASVPGYARLTLSPPASVPGGAFATEIVSTNSVTFVAERSLYAGANWKVGDASVASNVTATRWLFAEGATGYFHSYLLLGNPGTTQAIASLTFRLEGGTVVTSSVTVPARGRATVDLNGIPGLSNATFATDVTVTNGVPVIAERTMYWPNAGWAAVHISRGRPQ